jgi:hypothetical protein
MKKVNILVGSFNKVKIVFTDTLILNKSGTNKIIKFEVKHHKKINKEGTLLLPVSESFKDSFDYLYSLLFEYSDKLDNKLKESLTIKYFEGVLNLEL